MSSSLSPGTGRHVVADLEDCVSVLLNRPVDLELMLTAAADAAGAVVLSAGHHGFEPQGASAWCALAESHLAIHTWPELGRASLDAYTCGPVADPLAAVAYVVAALVPGHVHVAEVARGRHGFTLTERSWDGHVLV